MCIRDSWNGPTEYLQDGDILKTNITLVATMLQASKVYRVKVNTRPKTLFHRGCAGYHTDLTGSTHTSIFYMNTNNGYTKFKKGGKVKSVENRMVVFPADLEHQGFTCTDKQRRVLINFNFDR